MKGVELPINILVIVAVAVIVLLGIIALYMGGFGPFSASISYQAARNVACDELVRTGCGDPNAIMITTFDANQGDSDADGDPLGDANPAGDNLQELCENFYGVSAADTIACRSQCGCPVSG